MAKSIEQTVKFPLCWVLPVTDKFQSEECNKATNELIKSRNQGDDTEAKTALLATYTQEEKDLLNQFGVELHIDQIPVTITLGSLIFDIYTAETKQPEAPLAKAAFARKIQELAAQLNQDEFTLAADVHNTVAKVLSDDEKWSKSKFSAAVRAANGEEAYTTLSHVGVQYFGQIIEACLDIFAPAEPKET